MSVGAGVEPTVDDAPPPRRRGRPRHVRLSLDVMRRPEGRSLTPRELAELAGDISDDKIRSLIRGRLIRGVAVPSAGGRRVQWRIPYAEAQRWLRELRVL